jgi:hypothetical protein
MDNFKYIKENIEQIKSFLSGSYPGVKLLAVSKTFSAQVIEEAIKTGQNEFGESKTQEAEAKVLEINSRHKGIIWHDIGHLQGNKVNKAVKLFNCIQSVDSLKLAEKISAACVAENKEMEILLELKVSPEPSKSGFSGEEIVVAAEKVREMAGLRLKGIMTIAPYSGQRENARPYFKKARSVFDSLKKDAGPSGVFDTLSMGMTDDYTVAVEEGSTMVRIGTGIFGNRDYK